MKLHLGVLDVPYNEEGAHGTTTGDVAEFLEDRYGIMAYFFNMYGDRIAELMADSIAGALENMMAGAPPSQDPYAEAMSEIHNLFSQFLFTKKMDGQPGVPTLRAQLGISKRFKKVNGGREPRPSFIDTGLYEASMRAWVSGELTNAND